MEVGKQLTVPRPTQAHGDEQQDERGASEHGFGDPAGTVAARAEILIHDASGGVFAAAAAASDRQLVLYVEERARAAIDSLADVFIGYGVANTDVHRKPQCEQRNSASVVQS
jgi:hypothetical protein